MASWFDSPSSLNPSEIREVTDPAVLDVIIADAAASEPQLRAAAQNPYLTQDAVRALWASDDVFRQAAALRSENCEMYIIEDAGHRLRREGNGNKLDQTTLRMALVSNSHATADILYDVAGWDFLVDRMILRHPNTAEGTWLKITKALVDNDNDCESFAECIARETTSPAVLDALLRRGFNTYRILEAVVGNQATSTTTLNTLQFDDHQVVRKNVAYRLGASDAMATLAGFSWATGSQWEHLHAFLVATGNNAVEDALAANGTVDLGRICNARRVAATLSAVSGSPAWLPIAAQMINANPAELGSVQRNLGRLMRASAAA
jgi:hypothetical protein